MLCCDVGCAARVTDACARFLVSRLPSISRPRGSCYELYATCALLRATPYVCPASTSLPLRLRGVGISVFDLRTEIILTLLLYVVLARSCPFPRHRLMLVTKRFFFCVSPPLPPFRHPLRRQMCHRLPSLLHVPNAFGKTSIFLFFDTGSSRDERIAPDDDGG